jgi:hypothetical protein
MQIMQPPSPLVAIAKEGERPPEDQPVDGTGSPSAGDAPAYGTPNLINHHRMAVRGSSRILASTRSTRYAGDCHLEDSRRCCWWMGELITQYGIAGASRSLFWRHRRSPAQLYRACGQ